jgi:hypothetical protein
MDIEELLNEDEPAIVSETCRVVGELEHYRRDGHEATRGRVEALYRRVLEAVSTRDLGDLRAYAAQVARERSEAGYELPEVQAAFSALEKAIWQRALVRLAPYDQSWVLGLACTALAHGRAALGRAFDSLAPRTPAPCLDLTALFTGTERVAACDEMVYPA